MLILTLESSAKPASVAVYSDGALLGMYFQNSGLTHSRTLLVMAESLLKNLDLKTGDIGLIAVAYGPGSFTGVRIGVAAAKGLAFGLGIPVCGVSSLEAMAYQVPEPCALLCPVMDARRNQVYNALFMWQSGAALQDAAQPCAAQTCSLNRLCDDRAVSLEELAVELRSRQTPVLLTGDGAELTYDYMTRNGITCSMAPPLLRLQTAYGVALAALCGKHTNAEDLEPCYLRPSQAERERGIR